MSFRRQPALTPADERYLMMRTMVARCAPGLRTTSPTEGWHRLVTASEGVILVRTPQGAWSAPTSIAVWVPAGVRAELETCAETSLRMLYIRASRGAWSAGGVPAACQAIGVGPLLREVVARIAELPGVDRRLDWHLAL